jgi:hypothetical protein
MRIVLLSCWVTLALLACSNPCKDLAERICACEKTQLERQACRADRITSQERTIDDADAEVCSAALDTCTCQSLDENRLADCGFSPPTAP